MKQHRNLLLGAGALLLLTGCIDDKYDLANINTESEFKIDNLVLPVNLDPIELDDIITVEEDDQLKIVTINGETFYAVQESGTFESDDIDVNPFSATANPMTPNTATFRLEGSQAKPGRKAGESFKQYLIVDEVYESLDYEATDIDPAVRALTKLFYKPLRFTISISTGSLSNGISSHLENLTLKLPTGLTLSNVVAPGYTFKASDYNSSTGLLTLGTVNVVDNASSISIESTAIDLAGYPGSFNYNEAAEVGTFTLDSEFSIEKGCHLVLTGSTDELTNLPNEITYGVNYDITQLDATAILGDIQYDLKGTGLTLDPINLDNLPEFLENEETNLILANPQIYLNLDNPVGYIGLGYQSSLNIIAMREDGSETKFPLGTQIQVAGKTGSYNYLLAPKPADVTSVLPEYAAGLNRIPYSDLGRILSGKGLPQSLDIELINPMIPRQTLTEPFELGVNIPGMKGTYDFIAPLALEGDSRIIYTKTEDGWWSEDLEALTITSLEIATVASSQIPMDATLAVYPIDREGKIITTAHVEPVTIEANSVDKALTFVISGTITDLDGIFISATVIPDGSEEVLRPEQTITLKQLKAKVSGNYTKKL